MQKNWRYLVVGISSFIFLLLLALFALLHYRRRNRPLSDGEQLALSVRDCLEETYGPRARTIPLQMLNPDIPDILDNRIRAPTHDPIINRRQRQRDTSITTLAPLRCPSPPFTQGIRTPQRPGSARTAVSSRSIRTVSSQFSPQTLHSYSPGNSMRFYKAEQDMYKSASIPRFPGGQDR